MNTEKYVFISYSSKDFNEASIVRNVLEQNGLTCWMAPSSIPGGSNYTKEIPVAIKNCEVFLLILSDNAQNSIWVSAEVENAFKNQKIIIPFAIDNCLLSADFDFLLSRSQRIEAYEKKAEALENLVTLLSSVILSEASVKDNYRLLSKVPQARDIFYGREALLENIDDCFKKGNRIIFLEGIGGIGKSEIAKQYALKRRAAFKNIVFVTYSDSIKKMVCDPLAIEISNLEKGSDTEDEFFNRKMKVIRAVCGEETLFIVDNFDVDRDDDLALFLEGSYRIIFTTRNTHAGYPAIKVEPISDEKTLLKIFEKNYGLPIEESDVEYLYKLFKLIENHTYMIELVAKQMEASFLSAEEIYDLIKEGSLQSEVSETVEGRTQQKTAFEHLSSLFDISLLSEEEKNIMLLLSLMGINGVPAKQFKEWSGATDMNTVNKLVQRSFIRRGGETRLSLHPLMAEVVRKKLKPDLYNFQPYLKKIAHFAHFAWDRVYIENLKVADNIYSVLSYFVPLSGEGALYFEPMCSYLWQVGRFEDSIRFDIMLYESCLSQFGEASLATGFVAKSVGGAYFNSRRIKESVKWYEQGLKSMLAAGITECEDLAMAYEKVARCYTWDFNFNAEKAKEYFETALQIRLMLKAVLEKGDKDALEWFNCSKKCDLKMIKDRIGETYMETGRMYQAFGEYETALEYVEKYAETVVEGHSNHAYSLYDKGVCLYNIGKQKKAQRDPYAKQYLISAEKCLNQAFAINMKMRGDLANDTIENKEMLGDVYVEMECFDRAATAYEEAISMLTKLYGEDCDRIDSIRNKMVFG